MILCCLSEHNGNDTLLHATNLPGCCTRGRSLQEAVQKMPKEAAAFLAWCGTPLADEEMPTVEIAKSIASELNIADADSDVLYDSERSPLTAEEYTRLKALVLRSAEDFQRLYDSIPDKGLSALPERKTFYGAVPRTAEEMYRHTKQVNAYYFGEIGIDADNEGSILDCRLRGFQTLETAGNYLENTVLDGSYGELWTLKKVLRRFLWHDRIHAKAMFRMAAKTFGTATTENPFGF